MPDDFGDWAEPHLAFATSELAEAFAEWERRFREEPDAFVNDLQRYGIDTDDYGQRCARYLVAILHEQRSAP